MNKKVSILKKINEDGKWFTISNFLTVMRILLVPFIVINVIWEKWDVTFVLFVIAAVSDLLDGYLARLLKQQSYLGKILDPIADKFFLLASFSSLAFLKTPSFRIPIWFIVLFLVRETTILFGCYFIMRKKVDFEINPTIWGKLTTFFQILFIFWIFACYFFSWIPKRTYYVLLFFLALFSVISLFKYIKIGIQNLKNNL